MKNLSIAELEDLLNSDDELPDSYDEIPEEPKYKNDKRFEPNIIKFGWITNKQEQIENIVQAANVSTSLQEYPKNEMQKLPENIPRCDDRTLIKTGILSEQDITCLQSIANLPIDSATLIWFIDFLMYKDMQSEYKFLHSCLVHKLHYDDENKDFHKYFHMSNLQTREQLRLKVVLK